MSSNSYVDTIKPNAAGQIIQVVNPSSIKSEAELLSPGDKNSVVIDFNSLFKDLERQEMVALHKIYRECSSKQMLNFRKDYTRYLLQFGPCVLPTTFIACPTIREVELDILHEHFYLSFHDGHGYDFTSEFSYVYQARGGKESHFNDYIAIMKRALVAIDSSLSNCELESFAHYIVRLARWELQLGPMVVASTLSSIAPGLLINISPKRAGTRFNPGRVYIRRHSDETLSITIRFSYSISKASGYVYSPVDLANKQLDTRLFDACNAVMYRKHPLTRAAVEQFNQVSMEASGSRGGSRVPPPPPKNDIRVYLSMPSALTDEATTDDELADSLPAGLQLGSAFNDAVDMDMGTNLSRMELNENNPLSPCCELLGWGHDQSSALGLGTTEYISEPRQVPLPAFVPLECVRSIACSPRHSLLLTQMGSLFVCGDNSEGALGTGDVLARPYFSLLKWPASANGYPDAAPSIRYIAAGSGSIGSHSVAMDDQGLLYCWGVGYACGLGEVKPVLRPKLLSTFPRSALAASEDQQEQQEPELGQFDEPERNSSALVSAECAHVACGGGFTVAVLKSGKVCSWGMWAHGRLGLGPTPQVQVPGRNKSQKRMARYQLRPAAIKGIRNAVAVSCGEAHSLLLLNSGEVLSWGQNSCGQLGIGPSPNGFLTNLERPLPVKPFTRATPHSMSSSGSPAFHARSVHAGSFHSIVVDSEGHAWSWGARGSACLGHFDAALTGPWAERVNAIFVSATGQSKIMVPYELQVWCRSWSIPRRIDASIGVQIKQVAAGDMHTALLTSTGQLMLCGSGTVVPPYISAESMQKYQDDVDSEDENSGNASRKPSEFAPSEDQLHEIINSSVIVATPRLPSASWLSTLASRKTWLIAGSGSRLFALQDEELVCASLTRPLWNTLLHGPSADDSSISSSSSASYRNLQNASYFDKHGKADCLVIAGGKVLLAHKAILCQRSSELRELVEAEMSSDGDSDQSVQILLPQLQIDSAKALLHYLYTDMLPAGVATNLSLLHSLVKVGETLRLPRLQVLCEGLLRVLTAYRDISEGILEEFDDIYSPPTISLDVPPPTLARDLGGLVGDKQFADVRFIAEGRSVSAHRFILESRSEYFRAMFRSGMTAEAAYHSNGVLDVVVPDTFVGLLRLLIFLYTDTLPDASDGALLEDLMSAERYQLEDMKVLCESMLVPAKTNWLDLLRAADVLGSHRLHAQTVGFLRDNFSVLLEVTVEDEVHDKNGLALLQAEFPGLLERILESRRAVFPSPPSSILSDRMRLHAAEAKQALKKVPFPILVLIVLVLAILLHQYTSNVVVLGPYVPYFNAICIVAGIAFMIYWHRN